MSATGYTAVRTEGALLPPDLLARIADGDRDLPGLRPEDYGLAPGERIGDAIVRSWTRLNGVWQLFADKLDNAPDAETTFEAQTRKQWIAPLLQELGFGQPVAADPVVIDDKPYPVSHRAAGIAVHLIGARSDLDRRPSRGARPAHGMMQEFLNRSPDHLWGIVTNGVRLRLLRDSSSLTRQAFCEFDLDVIFRGQQYAEFALCWMVCHSTRFVGESPSVAIIEHWSNQARTEGTRALDQLRGGVEAAIEALGNGFLADPANEALRTRLRQGDLPVGEFQHQLLRLVYRLLFLLVAEARALMAAPGADPVAVDRYRRFYSVTRMVELARRQRGTAHGDLWGGLRVVFGALAGPGMPELGLYGMGSFLWSEDSLSDLGAAELPNRHLLEAISNLTMVDDAGGRRRTVRRVVDYRNLGAEELGSVYESLLELHPTFDGTTFKLASAAGNERKTTGSYYTPTPLIGVLLDSALDPVLDEAEDADDPEAALLALKVVDPAVGSGHFLIAAAHRIAHRLAAVRSGESEPAPDEQRHALREVIGHCIYGIDMNPMAVELCKVSLWMEATEPGLPLGFLDHRIVWGNSLFGTTPALMDAGVPDGAFKPLTGDDKAWVTALKRRNKLERKHREQGTLDFGPAISEYVGELAKNLAALDAMPDDSVSAIAEREARFYEIQHSDAANRAKFAADAWCAAFVAPKTPDEPAITDEVVRNCSAFPEKVPTAVRGAVKAMADQYRFLHLHLAFPDVFVVPEDPAAADNQLTGWSGGFDVVLGNPPWDQIQYDPQETFAVTHPEIATASTMAKRNRLIARLEHDEPDIFASYLTDVRHLDGVKHFAHATGRFPLGSVGRLNTAPLFVELMWNAISPAGRVGVVAPTGLATDSFTQGLFNALVDRGSLVSMYDFENRLAIFPGVHRSYKFSLLTLSGDDRPIDDAEFVFFALDVAELDDPEKRFTLSPGDFELLNPNTRTCPVFRNRRDAEITKGIYRRMPVLRNKTIPEGDPWGFSCLLMFMGTDRASLQADGLSKPLPVYEGKMVAGFDHRSADVYRSPTARKRQAQSRVIASAEHNDPLRSARSLHFVESRHVSDALDAVRWTCDWLLVWKDVTSASNERTLIAAVVPRVGCNDSLPVFISDRSPAELACWLGAFNSFALDYVGRQKVGGLHVRLHIAQQLPLFAPGVYSNGTERSSDRVQRRVAAMVLELSYTAWDLAGFAADLGYYGPPFRWDEERRALMRAELDALMFRLYGIERDDVDYILETFPIVKRKDEAAFGEYRTKRLILERFDAMAEADAAGREYETILDPQPADPSCAHPESSRPSWAPRI